MSIFVGIPTRGIIFTETLIGVSENLKGKTYSLMPIVKEPVDAARNFIISKFLESDADYLWTIDDDEVSPPGTLDAMIAADKPVVCVDAPAKKTGKSNVFRNLDGTVAATGFGCALFKREVFESLEKPWFSLAPRRQLIKRNRCYEFPIVDNTINPWGGEDVNFSLKLREKGYELYVLDGFVCDHLEYEQFARQERATRVLPIIRYSGITGAPR